MHQHDLWRGRPVSLRCLSAFRPSAGPSWRVIVFSPGTRRSRPTPLSHFWPAERRHGRASDGVGRASRGLGRRACSATWPYGPPVGDRKNAPSARLRRTEQHTSVRDADEHRGARLARTRPGGRARQGLAAHGEGHESGERAVPQPPPIACRRRLPGRSTSRPGRLLITHRPSRIAFRAPGREPATAARCAAAGCWPPPARNSPTSRRRRPWG